MTMMLRILSRDGLERVTGAGAHISVSQLNTLIEAHLFVFGKFGGIFMYQLSKKKNNSRSNYSITIG